MRRNVLSCILAAIIGALAVIVLGGCGARLSDGQAQALADARAGALAVQEQTDAIAKEPDPAAVAALTQALLDDLGRGALGFTLAATTHLDLPPSHYVPAELAHADAAAGYAEAGRLAAVNPPKGWTASAIARAGLAAVGAAGTLIAGVLALGKNAPGLTGLACGLAEAGWKRFAPDSLKAKDEAVDDGLDAAIAYGEYLAVALKRAGLGSIVDQAKDRARFITDRLHATDEVKRRLELVRSGALHPELSIATLPAFPAAASAPAG